MLQRGSYDDVWVRNPLGWRISVRKITLGERESFDPVERLDQPERIWDYPDLWEKRGDVMPRIHRDRADIVASVLGAYQKEGNGSSPSPSEPQTREVLSCPRVDLKTPDRVQVVVFWNMMGKKGQEIAYQNGRYVDQWSRASGEWKRVSRSKITEMEYSLPASAGTPWWAKERTKRKAADPEPVGAVNRFDPRMDALVAADAKIYKIAEGFGFTEGPVWLAAEKALLFSDIPNNVIHRWSETEGLSEFLRPSGNTGIPGAGKPEGSNGLTLDGQGRLVICQHGDRRVVRLTADKKFHVVADRFGGKRFNSPDDVIREVGWIDLFHRSSLRLAGTYQESAQGVAEFRALSRRSLGEDRSPGGGSHFPQRIGVFAR